MDRDALMMPSAPTSAPPASPHLPALRCLNALLGLGVVLVAVQILIGVPGMWGSLLLRMADVALAVLLLRAVGQAQEDLAERGLEPMRVRAAVVAAWGFITLSVLFGVWQLLQPGLPVAGAGAVSAIGKAAMILLALSLRYRIETRIRAGMAPRGLLINPAVAVLTSFAVAIAAGWLLLSLPEASRGNEPVDALNSLFTSTSATCVTGLIVLDTPTAFSPFGLTVILLLIQVGGLGIMTLGGMYSAAAGQRVSMQQRALARDTIIFRERGRLSDTLKSVALFTLIAETLGALVLFLRWWSLGETLPRALALAVFHSVSAFCNAGFSLFSTGLEAYTMDFWINAAITGLIIFGGIGFPVVVDVWHTLLERRRGLRARLSLHSRLALVTTGYLLVLGFVGFLVLEWAASLQGLSPAGRLQAAWFQSVTPRTAGFNTIPMTSLQDSTRFLLILLMFVGASPGSTGGGIKTTTLAVVALLSDAMIHGRAGVHAGGREIPEAVRHRAVAILILFGMSVLIWTFGLAVMEFGGFLDLLFETVSAFGTVGLSTLGSANLSSAGRLAIILAMYMGRVGPLTVALALAARRRRLELRHPEEPVMVG